MLNTDRYLTEKETICSRSSNLLDKYMKFSFLYLLTSLIYIWIIVIESKDINDHNEFILGKNKNGMHKRRSKYIRKETRNRIIEREENIKKEIDNKPGSIKSERKPTKTAMATKGGKSRRIITPEARTPSTPPSSSPYPRIFKIEGENGEIPEGRVKLHCNRNQSFNLLILSDPSTHMEWQFESAQDPRVLHCLDNKSTGSGYNGEREMVGVPGFQIFKFRPILQGRTTLTFRYLKPAKRKSQDDRTLYVKFRVF